MEDPIQNPSELSYCVLAGGALLWFNQTRLQMEFADPGEVPLPNTPFPYRRIASAI